MTITNEEWILAFGGSDHDYSAALLHGTDIKVAIERERITRVKHGAALWYEEPFEVCAEYCLSAAGVERDVVSRVVSHDLLPNRSRAAWSMTLYDHHLCHAASAVMLLEPNVRACVLVYDGCGSVETTASDDAALARHQTFSFYEFDAGELRHLGTTYGERFIDPVQAGDGGTNSMGDLYSLVGQTIGFERLETGKTMGLAAWGEPLFVDDLMEHVTLGPTFDAAFAFDPFDVAFQAMIARWLNEGQGSFAVRADLAASVQEALNRVLVHCYELAADRDFDVFCLAGGCALNTVGNGVLAEHLPDTRSLLVPPHAGDSGLALGALWLDVAERCTDSFALTLRGAPLMPAIARPGRRYEASSTLRAASRQLGQLAEDPSIDGPDALANVIACGKAVGVVNGPSEIGPRALGGRSVLADPRDPAMKERVNRQIKQREPFRPLAPMVLAEDFGAYFEPDCAADPFMLMVARAKDRCVRDAPAVIHVDGTARVQVIGPDGDPFVRRLLGAFGHLTGVPILLNTSFNRRGEPIVESPDDAVDAFLSMQLDGLYLDGRFLYRPN